MVVPVGVVAHAALVAVGRRLVRGVGGVRVVGLAVGVVAIPVHGALVLVGIVRRLVVVLVIAVIVVVIFNLVGRDLVGLGVCGFLIGAVGLAVRVVGLAIGIAAITIAHRPLMTVGGLVRRVGAVRLAVRFA